MRETVTCPPVESEFENNWREVVLLCATTTSPFVWRKVKQQGVNNNGRGNSTARYIKAPRRANYSSTSRVNLYHSTQEEAEQQKNELLHGKGIYPSIPSGNKNSNNKMMKINLRFF